MFREMRRGKQQLSLEDAQAVLASATSGVLALAGDEYPYAVPMSYVYDKETNAAYFHSAVAGHKIDCIRENPKASFCVIAQDDVLPEKLTTCYKSVIAFGSIVIIEDAEEKLATAEKLGMRYDPEETSNLAAEIESAWDRFAILEFKIDHLTGKRGKELCC